MEPDPKKKKRKEGLVNGAGWKCTNLAKSVEFSTFRGSGSETKGGLGLRLLATNNLATRHLYILP